ncbi:MAG: hypothetical protein KIT36_09855 [Alphaproteobacteria bacterium]|nr:hypothetical protein [Alphaproteobacteria bacterium]
MFDVELTLSVQLTAGVLANAHIRFLGDAGRHEGRWKLIGRQDHRLPHFGTAVHTWHWDTKVHSTVVLMHNHKPWAFLYSFPAAPTRSSKSLLQAFRLPIGPASYQPNGWYVGEWAVITNAHHRNLPFFDPDDSAFQQAIASCTVDTGFRFDTSWGVGAAGGAGIGGGLQPSATIVLKRRDQEKDVRRWHLNYWAIGAGVTTPGVSAGGSTSSTPSRGLTEVLAGPNQPVPFPVENFAGNIVIVDVGAGFSIGKGKVAVGVGGSRALVMFTGVTATNYSFGDYAQIKALLLVEWAAGAGGKGNTKLLGGGGAATMFVGTVSVTRGPNAKPG